MAFGFGGGGDDIEIKVTLDTQQAEREADRVTKDIQASFKKIESAAKNPIDAISSLGQKFVETNPKAAALATQLGNVAIRLAPMAGAAVAATAAIAGLTIGFNKLISIAGDGDKFGDISDAFQDNADKAGVLADELLNNLSKAFLGTADSATLMTEANKAFALGIDPSVFDDLAAAAKRYADATGGDATQALDELIQGVNTGREALLRKFGTIENGLLVLNQFTDAEYQNGIAASNVTDIYERFQARIASAYAEFAQAVNNSDALKLATQALTSVLGTLAEVLSTVGQAVLSVADFFARQLQTAIDGVLAGFTYLSSVVGDLSSGQLPDFGKAFDAAARRMAGYQKQTESAGKVTVKLGNSVKEAGRIIAKDGKDSIGEAVQALTDFEKQINKTLGIDDFRLSPQLKVIKDQVREAFTLGGGDKQKILDALKANVIGPYLKEVEAIPDEFKKRIGELQDVIGQVSAEQSKAVEKAGKSGSLSDIAGDNLASALGFTGENLDAAAQAISSGLSTALSAAFSGGAIDEKQLAVAFGTTIGAVIGAAYGGEGGAQIGGAIGTIVGQVGVLLADEFGKDSAGTRARKSADKYFADIFNAERLAVVIDGQIQRIRDLQFSGNEDSGGLFATLPQDSQSAFNAVGASFEQLLGIAEDYGGRIAGVLANNVGGSLEGLQVLIQATGKSFEELGDAIIESFLNGNLSIQEAYDSLAQLSDLFQSGIPGQVGAIDQAFRNFDAALQDGRGSRILIDSLRDIGAEAQELGIKDFPTLANRLVQSFGFAGPQIDAFFAALKASGINSITDLVNASSAALIGLARNVQLIQQGAAPTATTITDPTAGITAPGNFTAGGESRSFSAGGGSSGGRSSAQSAASRAESDRKRKLQELQQETIKLVTASASYTRIIDELNRKLISSKDAGEEINALYKRQFTVLQAVQKAQDAYNKAIANGVSGRKLGDLAKALEKAQAAADKLNQKIGDTGRVDLSGLTKYITSLNQLGVVSKAVGVNADTLVNTLVQGFLRGKLSISQVNDEIAKVKDLLGNGIPGAVGAVDEAFANLQKGGRNGGLFSVDAFKDVFAEFDERFSKSFGPERQRQIQQLTNEFNAARDALESGIASGKSPAEIQDLRKQFQGVQRTLQDIQETIPKAGFEDLRAELKKTFSGDQVDVFFRALQESGVSSFDEFKNASNDLVVGVLGNLDRLGFDFAATTDESTAKLIEQFNQLNVAQTDNKDVLQEQLDLINKFTSGVGGPFEKLANDFGGVIEKLALFDGKTYSSDIILNVDFNAKNSATQDLIDLLFGSGSGTTSTTGGDGPGLQSGLTSSEKQEFFALRRKKKGGKLSAADQRRFDELNGKRGG